MGRGANTDAVTAERSGRWNGINAEGLPRPLWDNPELGLKPVPWTTETYRSSSCPEPDFGSADPERMQECWRLGLCVLCGEALTETVAAFIYAGDPPDGFGAPGCVTDGPLHERCAKMTAAHCPPISLGVAAGKYRPATFPFAVWEALQAEWARIEDLGEPPLAGYTPLPVPSQTPN